MVGDRNVAHEARRVAQARGPDNRERDDGEVDQVEAERRPDEGRGRRDAGLVSPIGAEQDLAIEIDVGVLGPSAAVPAAR